MEKEEAEEDPCKEAEKYKEQIVHVHLKVFLLYLLQDFYSYLFQ
jgi:hypothetical protein